MLSVSTIDTLEVKGAGNWKVNWKVIGSNFDTNWGKSTLGTCLFFSLSTPSIFPLMLNMFGI